MRHGGKRPGSGRPKQRTVLDVALSLSAPAVWEASLPVSKDTGNAPVSARYRPSKASAVRSSIPAAAVRRQEIEVNAGRPRRSLSEIEMELVERTHAQTANDTTITGFTAEIKDAFQSGALDSIFIPRGESSMSDFLYEDFYGGGKEPGELRGLRRVP